MLERGTQVVVNRPGHWSHLLRGEVVGGDAAHSIIKVRTYLNNEQSHNPAIRLVRPQADAPEQAEVTVRDTDMWLDDSNNHEAIETLISEALDA